MQKRVHSREFKLEVVRQVATGQKRQRKRVANMAWLTVCFHDGAKSIKSEEKLHLRQLPLKSQRPRNKELLS